MQMRYLYAISIGFTLAFILFIPACKDKSLLENVADIDKYTQQQLDSLTLASLKKVDDYPLYVMTFYGDYGFAEYLQTGISTSTSANLSTQQTSIRWACTCFAALGKKGFAVFGRNFDWVNRASLLLFTNPPGAYAAVSMVDLNYFGYNANNLPDSPGNRENLLGTPYLPFDGLNERGVAIGMMAIPQARAPYDPKKVTIGEIQVIRLVLDYAKNVNDAISLIQKYNIEIQTPPIHYLIADSSGNSAVIEFIDGNMIIIRNDESWQVSTNFIIHGSGAPDNVSCWRYNTAYQALKEAGGYITHEVAMELLRKVSQSSTMWSTVYDINSREIHVAVGRKYDAIKKFELKINEE